MVFHITFMLALFHGKKYYNYINLFPCILWDLIVFSLVLNGEDLLKKLILRFGSQVVQPAKVTWGVHAGSWRVSGFRDSSHDLANLRDDPWNALIARILSVTLILFTHTIYTLITHKIMRRLLKKKNHKEVSTTHPPLLERATHPKVRKSL